MDLEYELGQPLIVELQNETLVGELKLISGDGRLVELTNVRDFNTGFIYTSTQCLPSVLIKSMRKCKKNESVKTANIGDGSKIDITNSDFDRMQELIAGVTYIFQIDKNYHNAIADIKYQHVIALHLEPAKFGRHNWMSLMAVATCRNVYIFDLIVLGKLFKELKNILQSQRPKKIVYYSNHIADNLKYQHSTELNGVFDIYVAHCLISNERTPVTFKQCVMKYFNIPQNYFQGEGKMEKHLYERPLTASQLGVVSKRVLFLHKLYEIMLHGTMLKKFYTECSNFSLLTLPSNRNLDMITQMKVVRQKGT